MEDKSKLFRIAITSEEITDNEPLIIRQILTAGWDMVHLRHPYATLRDMRNLIESIPQNLHHKLRLHGHFELCHSFNLGGIHLNSRCNIPPDGYTGKISKSCHNIDEVITCKGYDYVTLSPIFDSISKPGYNHTFSNEELIKANHDSSVSVIALGGITPEKITDIKQLGFRGYAVLGALMMQARNLEKFQTVLSKFSN